tara:strand:+ start:353 stop:814 length:462 start_codon:yes stop_codon:yes gene_type:complete
MRIALYEPDIPQNTGAIIRLASCFDIGVDIIEPCGFVFSSRRMKRSGMDYIDRVDIKLYSSWEKFYELYNVNIKNRIILLTTKGNISHTKFSYTTDDILLLGRESAGVPDAVHLAVNSRIIVPIVTEARSLNIVTSAAMVLGEALRQTSTYPN